MKKVNLASMLAIVGGLTVATSACSNEANDAASEPAADEAVAADCGAEPCAAAADCGAQPCAASDCGAKPCAAAADCGAKPCAAHP